MSNIFTSTTIRCPGYLFLLLLTIGYLSRSTEGGGIQCYTCSYDEPINGPFEDHLRCDVTKEKKTCGAADGCVTVHHEINMTGSDTKTSHREGVGTCMETETMKCIETVTNITLQPGKEINCERSFHDHATMVNVLNKCFDRNYGPSSDNETKWDITAYFCSCYGKLCNGKGEPTNNGTGVTPKPPPPGPVAPPTTGKATRDLFGGWAVIWTTLALAAGLLWGVKTS